MSLDEEAIDELTQVLGHVKDPIRIKEFLFCLLTKYEIEEVASRWELVKLLDEGVSQRNIAAQLGLSLCKITRGSKELKKTDSAFKEFIEIGKRLHPGKGPDTVPAASDNTLQEPE